MLGFVEEAAAGCAGAGLAASQIPADNAAPAMARAPTDRCDLRSCLILPSPFFARWWSSAGYYDLSLHHKALIFCATTSRGTAKNNVTTCPSNRSRTASSCRYLTARPYLGIPI